MEGGQISLFGREYKVNDTNGTEMLDISLRLSADQARRLEAEAPEATSLQEAVRIMAEDGLRRRESELRQSDIEDAVKAAIGDLETMLRSGELTVRSVRAD